MKLHIFTVHDSKAEAYLQPFFALTVGMALRDWRSACNDQDHQFHRHAGDYNLFELGTYEQQTAKFEIHDSPINHGLALSQLTTPVDLQDAKIDDIETLRQDFLTKEVITPEDALRHTKTKHGESVYSHTSENPKILPPT